MLNISYTISPNLKVTLDKIETQRRSLLLTPLSPKTEIRLRWEAMLNRIYWSLSLTDNEITKAEMVRLLISHPAQELTSQENEVIKYKKAFDYISENWLVTSRAVTSRTIFVLHEIACYGRPRASETTLREFLEYLQASSEHPVIQAAIAQLQLVYLSPFTDGNGRTARLLSYIFLYKSGYDFRGMLALEEYFRRDLVSFRENTAKYIKGGNVTLWLEYFANCVQTQLEKTLNDIYDNRFRVDVPASFLELNDRQRAILAELEAPGSTITNKKVQRQFKVSQITASRDLTKLTSLGLLFSHGKGRSVYYTKV